MKKKIIALSTFACIALSVTFLFSSGCQKEYSISAGIQPGTQTQPELPISDAETVTASVSGIIVDENNVPVAAATVTSGTNTAMTDRFGVFRFNNISLSKNNGYVKVAKNGYFQGSRSFVTSAGRTHNVRIKLLPKTTTGSFTGTAGGTVVLTGGAKMVIPSDAVTDGSGSPYTGTVNVAMSWLDPTSNELPYTMPGDLRGITATGNERGLESFGMAGVELTGSSGQILNIATGKKAELTFPIPTAIAGSAPATIDLWYFDEASGRWEQEGTATKIGSNYVGQVSHFSFWNVDAPYPLVEVCMSIVEQSNSYPLNGIQVRIKRPNGSYAYARTDSAGSICGKLPANEALTLEILNQCNNVIVSKSIGPFASNATLSALSVTIPATSSVNFTGTIQDCNNANVTNGAAIVYISGGYSYNVPLNNGAFSLTVLVCTSNPVSYSILPVDITAMQQGVATTGNATSGTVNIGTLKACGTSTQEFIEMMVDGVPTNFVAPADSLVYYDSTFGTAPPAIQPVIEGSKGNKEISFSFLTSTGTAGTYPIRSLDVRSGTATAQQIASANPVVTITEIGPVKTGFIEGSFSVQMNFSGTPKTVSATFKIRRIR